MNKVEDYLGTTFSDSVVLEAIRPFRAEDN
jgi:hypothetical protein